MSFRALLRKAAFSMLTLVLIASSSGAEARSRTFVSVTIGGTVALGAAYLAWTLVFSKEASKKENDAYLASNEESPHEDASEFRLDLLTVRF
jgi:hypothetical protein